ncbi:hypothetical protein F2Q69_00046886 [Brassica cretica]|uniref:Uncharacterized protein n=1 Tax=Brassica cretica TaxID=69181 RepID=A0A8S9PUQ2_BRACR|nr:hypothetical protein F2Q69_00046886 [Brassica cretica]
MGRKVIRPKNGTLSQYGFDMNSGPTRDGSQSVAGCDTSVPREEENCLELTTPSNQRQVLEEEQKESKDSDFIRKNRLQNLKSSQTQKNKKTGRWSLRLLLSRFNVFGGTTRGKDQYMSRTVRSA